MAPISVPLTPPPPEPSLPEPWSWNVPTLLVHLTANQQQVVMGRLRSIGAIAADVQTWPTA